MASSPATSARSRRLRAPALLLAGLGLGALALDRLSVPAASAEELVGRLVTGLVLAAATRGLLATRLRSLRVATALGWVAIAVVIVLWPVPTTDVLARILAAAIVLGAVVDLVLAVRSPSSSDQRFAGVAGGVAHLGLAAAVLLWPSISAFTLGAATSGWLLLLCVQVVVLAIDRLRLDAAPAAAATDAAPRWSRAGRVAGSLGLLLLGALVVVAAIVVDRSTVAAGPGPFYATPDRLDQPSGTVLRVEVVDGFTAGATAYRVLYTSVDLTGEPTAKSGVVVIPDDPDIPSGGRPVLAHTHGTIGIDRRCAPSLLDERYAGQMWGLEGFVAEGWIVAAPDYLGLGGEGDHPYLIGEAAAAGTLDIVRAAIELADGDAAPRFAVAGHSQGGHAALFTGQLAPELAPELELIAVGAIAPASELASFIASNDGTIFGNLLGAYAVAAWDRVFDDVDLHAAVDPAALPVVERLTGNCLAAGPELLALMIDAELLHLGFLATPIWDIEPWAGRIAANTPGAEPIHAPLLLVQGARDALIQVDIQRGFVDRLCTQGQQLTYRELPDAGHLDIDEQAAELVVGWLTDRLTTPAAGSTCPDP